MRSRFLNIDCFSLAPPESTETLAFLHLPVPCLPFPPPSTVQDHLHFHSTLHSSLHIDRLPIDDALSKFLSGVLPQRLDVDFQYFEGAMPSNHICLSSSSSRIAQAPVSQEAVDVFEENEMENCRILDSGADIEFSNERKSTALIEKNEGKCDMTQFEMPELDVLLGSTCFPEEVVMQILDETSENEHNLEMLKSGLSMQFPYEVLHSISAVEYINSDYLGGQNTYSSDDYMSLPNPPKSGQRKFPILEVDEESLGILTFSCMEENVDSYFDNIGPQNMDETHSVIEPKEILGGMSYNIMNFLSDDCPSQQTLVLPDILHEIDFIIMLETENLHGNPALTGKSESDMITFQEILFIDESSIQIFESFYNTKLKDDPVTSEFMFKKDFNFKDFDELIISNEIALMDDVFKPLPVPALSDHGKMRSLSVFIEERLSNLKTQPQSASDSIYLDWDLLEEDKRNFNLYHYFQNMWAKRDLNITFGGESFNDGKLVFDLVSLSDVLDGCHIEQSEELQKLLSDFAYRSDKHTLWAGSSNQLDGRSPKQEIGEQLAEKNAERASLWFKSTSEVSHLDYFLNPQKSTARRNCNLAVESNDADVDVLKATCNDFKYMCGNTILQSQGWNIDLHNVLLSDRILAIVGNFEKFYWAVLQSETELTQNSSMDHFQLMKLPKYKLKELSENGKNMAFVLLCAIKQAAWYLCFYGLRPASLYLDELCQSLDNLKLRFSFLQSLIKDENKKIGDKITLAHPALAVFDKILQSNIKQDGLKVLIVTEEVFWWSLKCLLISIGLSFNEFHDTRANQPYAYDTVEDTNSKLKDIVNSNCLIVSYKHISPFFPFNKFGIILEYGGPLGSSRIPNLSPNSTGLSHLHFLKVELDVHPAVKALCEGVEMPLAAEMSVENGIHNIINPNKRMMDPKLEKLLNFCPLEKNHDIGSSKIADDVECFVPPLSSGQPEHSHQSMESYPETLVIVNTQNVDKEMIVSRRSTYQAILAMEKQGIQVVERDLDLPVDIIISSAICLVWYDKKNLGKKATPATEASSSLPLCIENIAANILTLLSFSYEGCFLVFEGEINFISTIMESSDGLYAAAASLGIHLQIFCSYSPEFTNEIIISCINSATKLTRGLYPKMPDSLTLAESFLTKFPTINPLVAHAILSTGATLTEILGWSHERRINVLKRYNVPEESIDLFSALCKYGEREDSKSIMTDCSSSVSSGPYSDRCHLYQIDDERKRKKQVESSEEFVPYSDELLQFEPLQDADGFLDSSNLSKHTIPGRANYTGRSNDLTRQGFNVTTTPRKTPASVSQPSCDPWGYKAPLIMEQKKQPPFSFKDDGLVPNDKSDTARMNKNLSWHGLSFSGKLDEDIRGEVVDLTEDPLLNKNFSFNPNLRNFPRVDFMNSPDFLTQAEKVQTKNNTVRRLSFGQLSQPEFKDIWNSSNDARGEVNNNPEPNFGMEFSPLDAKCRGKNSDEGLTPAYKRNLQGSSPFQEEMSQLGGRTPLSRALNSTTPLKNSPWTLEFINRIKEKSRLRQKALSCDNSLSCFGYSDNTLEVANRRRPPPPPPPPESFAYQGRSIEKTPKQKRQKQCAQPLKSAKNGKRSASLLPSWTPHDKRATKMLSFAMNESQSQTKLVWNDETQCQAKKFRYQTHKSR